MVAEVVTLEPRSLRVALVGCGRISAYHLAALKGISGVEIVAVCDLDGRVARETATRHGVRGCYTDMEAMLRDLRPPRVPLAVGLARVLDSHGGVPAGV
jgi:UDP-N-acetyl-2-amino-2-deoxyglucuronate dehydrogenase